MPPAVLEAALRYKADLARREGVAMRSMASHWLNVTRALEGEIGAVARTMALRRSQGLPVTAGYLYRTERYQELLKQAYGQFIRYEDFAADLIARNTATFARLGREYGLGLLDIVEPGIHGGFNKLNVGAIETIAGFVEPGSPLRALLADAWPAAIEQTTNALVRGVALGYNPRKIAKMMNDGMSSGLYRSMVIARTETLRAYRTNKMDVWRESGLVRGFQRVSTHDRRVCPACLFAEGQFIPVQDDFAEHPQGRCSLVPVTRNSGLHQWQYGPEWFEEQPTATQVSILGPGRHAAWKAGKFNLRDVPTVQPNTTWGPSMRARGLAELTGGSAGHAAALVRIPAGGFTNLADAKAYFDAKGIEVYHKRDDILESRARQVEINLTRQKVRFERDKFIENWTEILADTQATDADVLRIQNSIAKAVEANQIGTDVVFQIRKQSTKWNEKYLRGEYHEGDDIITMYTDDLAKTGKVKESISSFKTLVAEAYDDELQGIVVHEYGHHYTLKLNRGISRRADNIMDEIYEDVELKKWTKHNISYYSVTNGHELAAEAYTMTRHPDYATAPAEIKSFIARVMGGE